VITAGFQRGTIESDAQAASWADKAHRVSAIVGVVARRSSIVIEGIRAAAVTAVGVGEIDNKSICGIDRAAALGFEEGVQTPDKREGHAYLPQGHHAVHGGKGKKFFNATLPSFSHLHAE
jgi:hypothetical protein